MKKWYIVIIVVATILIAAGAYYYYYYKLEVIREGIIISYTPSHKRTYNPWKGFVDDYTDAKFEIKPTALDYKTAEDSARRIEQLRDEVKRFEKLQPELDKAYKNFQNTKDEVEITKKAAMVDAILGLMSQSNTLYIFAHTRNFEIDNLKKELKSSSNLQECIDKTLKYSKNKKCSVYTVILN